MTNKYESTNMEVKLRRNDLVYPELSYKIVGCAYDVFNELGPGHYEKYYQKALASSFEIQKLSYKEQVYYPLKFKNEVIGKSFFDFLVEDKVIVEIKKDLRFSKARVDQVVNYLNISGLRLALLINFAKDEVVFKRFVNINNEDSYIRKN
ncbi:MAG: GxxExxY protein [Bacteroidia bacterium]|nr:GxxExxY protein [Bacteroidia bacterium]